MGFGKTKGTSQQQSSEQWNYGTNVWGPQAGFLQDIYNQAQGMQQGLQGYAGQAGLDQMQGALGQSQQALQRLANPDQTDPLMGMYAKQIGQQFNEQIAPGIRGDAMLGGNRGGSRQGIGLGLAVSKSIIDRHGGQIEARSTAGKGTTFTIRLPLAAMV